MVGRISAVRFKNYKRLKNFSLRAQHGNVLVGPNNSGKSSILDAFRLLEAALRFSRHKKPTLISNSKGVFDGYMIPESAFPFHLMNVVTNYDDDEFAKIEFDHETGATAHLWLSNDRTVTFFVDRNGKRFANSKQLLEAFPVDLVVVPTLSPLESEEVFIQKETVQRNRTTRLAARNFRNIWYLEDKSNFEIFKERVERAWKGVKLLPPELVHGTPSRVEMFFEEKRITREIQWAGFGFQVWLQIHTHLMRGGGNSILILDEPDVYLHPDLQHRLYRDVKELFGQFFLATHAIEIINVAETSEILMIEPDHKAARKIKRDSDYDAMLDYIGSAENADFAKISRVKRVLFVEGHDAKILRRLAKNFGFSNLSNEQLAPIFQLGGFSQWRRAESTVWAFKNLLDIEISTICLFDRDYRPAAEVYSFTEDLSKGGIECYVLERKEIENYLICPSAITKAVNARKATGGKISGEVNEIEVFGIIEEVSDQQKNYASAQFVANALRFAKEIRSSEDDSKIIERATRDFDNQWGNFDSRKFLLPGKETIKRIFDKVQEKYGVSISTFNIIDKMKQDEVGDDLLQVLSNLDRFFDLAL